MKKGKVAAAWDRFRFKMGIPFGERSNKSRYSQLLDIIRDHRCKNIMEIGTHGGITALLMIEEAQIYNDKIIYAGFDLFEQMTPLLLAHDPSSRPQAPTQNAVAKKLAPTHAEIHLYKGLSSETVPRAKSELPLMDLIFIDGSHVLADIEEDWKNAQAYMHKNTIVVFDDYWNTGWNGDFSVGCKKLIDKLAEENEYDVKILPITKLLPREWGTLAIQLAQATRK